MEMWKWSLAFQCVVNIGVRGSENVRTRVVEADMVPVIATILDNYIKVVDKVRLRSDTENQKASSSKHPRTTSLPRDQASTALSSVFDRSSTTEQRQSRRQGRPPSIEIPQPFSQDFTRQHYHHHHHHHHHRYHHNDSNGTDETTGALTSPPERTTFPRDVHNLRFHDARYQPQNTTIRSIQAPLATAVPTMNVTDGFGFRPVREADLLPSMLPRLQTGLSSQPESPTTPSGPAQPRSGPQAVIRRQRPSLRQQQSGSGESDDANGEDSPMAEDVTATTEVVEPIVGVQNGMELDNVGDGESMLDDVSDSHGLAMTDPSRTQDTETFNITHRLAVDGSLINTATPTNGPLAFSPVQAPNNTNSPVLAPNSYSTFLRDRTTNQGVLTAMPRDEDVLMSLQLLAYVSKYCNLRSYFQNSHLVPKLKIGRELSLLDDPTGLAVDDANEEEDEYLLPDDFNIFPLVEKFTVRHHSKDMQYWACVVMRNRKVGGISTSVRQMPSLSSNQVLQ
jgi:hypothetical protein